MKDHNNFYFSCEALNDLVVDTLKHLENLGYLPNTFAAYRRTWRAFLLFTHKDSGGNKLFQDLVDRFLESRRVPTGEVQKQLCSLQRHIRAAMRILSDFALDGSYRIRRPVVEKIKLSPVMEHLLSDYEQFSMKYLRIGFRTMRVRKQNIRSFLYYLKSRGISSIKKIQTSILSEFVRSCTHLKTTTLAPKISHIRLFMRYLCMQGLLPEVFVEHVPKVRVQQPDARIPAVWRSKEVEALLAAVDRNSPCGKRDYAILLLAARLGMRVGDIRTLRLENLRWDEARIEIMQAKTGIRFCLPLTEEVGNAIIDYLRNGRPRSHHREVFLRINAPFKPIDRSNNLHYIVTKYRRKAGIKLPAQGLVGLHSLRHTLASQLLDQGVTLETISGVLGHLSQETTRIYTKVDIESLRRVAIDPEEVTHE